VIAPPRGLMARVAAPLVVVVGVAAAGVVLAAAEPLSVAAPAAVSVPAERVEAPANVLVIGDSAIAAIRWVPRAASAVTSTEFIALDLESCRRLVVTSCRGREGRRPPTVLDVVRTHGSSFSTIVVATGYNDSSGSFGRWFATIVAEARARGVQRIIWFSLRDDERAGERAEVYRQHNRLLVMLTSFTAYDDVVLADWNGYTAERPEWFRSDGIHYSTVGAWGAADYLSRTLAHLDGRPCPMPEVPGGVRQAPCPDPDQHGPPPAIEDLYPVRADGVLCYRVGADARLVCAVRPDEPAERFVEVDAE
jgi:hypothetical protein